MTPQSAEAEVKISIGVESYAMSLQPPKEIIYNISQSLTRINTIPAPSLEKFNKFITELDQKIHIEKNDPKYEFIYKDIQTIVTTICEEVGRRMLFGRDSTFYRKYIKRCQGWLSARSRFHSRNVFLSNVASSFFSFLMLLVALSKPR